MGSGRAQDPSRPGAARQDSKGSTERPTRSSRPFLGGDQERDSGRRQGMRVSRIKRPGAQADPRAASPPPRRSQAQAMRSQGYSRPAPSTCSRASGGRRGAGTGAGGRSEAGPSSGPFWEGCHPCPQPRHLGVYRHGDARVYSGGRGRRRAAGVGPRAPVTRRDMAR
jgi:hypothetical protein